MQSMRNSTFPPLAFSSQQKEGEYKFLNGKPVPGDWDFWFPKQPNNYLNQDCITTQGGKWDDTQCKYERGFVCQHRSYTPAQPEVHTFIKLIMYLFT